MFKKSLLAIVAATALFGFNANSFAMGDLYCNGGNIIQQVSHTGGHIHISFVCVPSVPY